MPKNVTIYIPDEIAEQMLQYPEVNWSEVSRKAITEYMNIRNLDNFMQTAKRLEAEGNEEYNKGKLFFEEVAKQMTLADFEKWYPEINKDIIVKEITPEAGILSTITPYRDAAELQAIQKMRERITRFCKSKKIETPEKMSDVFCKGAIRAFMNFHKWATRRGTM